MRSEVKIGIAAVLFVALIAGVYFLATSGTEEQPEPADRQAERVARGDGEDAMRFGDEEDDETGGGLIIGDADDDTDGPDGMGFGGTTDTTDTAGVDDDGTISIGFDEPSPPAAGTVDATETTGTTDAGADADDGSLEIAGIGFDTDGGTGADDGFRIEEGFGAADEDTGAVEAGGVGGLYLEPDSTPTPGAADATGGKPGETFIASDGRRYYIVVDGDAGFWQIAKKVYNAGKHWERIAKANPEADTNRLREGQKLLVPPLPETPAAGGTDGATGGSATATADGNVTTDVDGTRYYVVAADDTGGFWDISKKAYNTGKHWELVAKANPQIDPRALRAGMKVKIPPRPEPTTRRISTETVTGTPERPGPNEYIVEEGDSAGFWGIAKKVYGEGRLMGAIAAANPNINPRRLRVGQKIKVPPIREARRLAGVRETDADGGFETVSEPVASDDDARPIFDID